MYFLCILGFNSMAYKAYLQDFFFILLLGLLLLWNVSIWIITIFQRWKKIRFLSNTYLPVVVPLFSLNTGGKPSVWEVKNLSHDPSVHLWQSRNSSSVPGDHRNTILSLTFTGFHGQGDAKLWRRLKNWIPHDLWLQRMYDLVMENVV